jgi:activated CDC42 kinase 1
LKFTSASDVWAYGVCLWEMFSYGFQPWPAFTGHQILEAIDKPNFQRLEQPECCPKEFYNLMLKCWAHDPLKRPKFSEIYSILPEIKPEQLKTVSQCIEMKKDYLTYRQGDIITVLDKVTDSPYWLGVLNNGRCGLFNPSITVAHIDSLPSSTLGSGSSSGSQTQLGGFIRNTLERNSKRKLKTDMISSPQNDFKHTGHVGIDGLTFGNVAFISNSQTYSKLPRQVVTPYKPSEDLEQTPLLLPPTPTSPTSTQTASAYFSESSNLLPNHESASGTNNNNESLSSDFQRITTSTRTQPVTFSESNPFAQSDHQLWTPDMGKNFASVSEIIFFISLNY